MSNVYGVDIGTSNFKMYSKEKDTVLNEKNIIAIANKTEVFAIGNEAFLMHEKAPDNIVVSYPVKFGVIADIENMETLFECFFNKINGGKVAGANEFFVAVPTDITEVEKKAFYDLVSSAKVKAKTVYIVDKPVADAIGAGIDVTEARGVMVVNIGSDTTEVSVLSLGGIVLSKSIKIGGNKLDDNIISGIRKNYNLVIGNKTAEAIKIKIGSAVKTDEVFTKAFGRNIMSGLPVAVDVSSDVVHESIIEQLRSILDAVKVILEKTPPELAADIIENGIYITGGTSSIRNLKEFMERETNLTINIVESASESVVRGIKDIISTPSYRKLAYLPKEKNYI